MPGDSAGAIIACRIHASLSFRVFAEKKRGAIFNKSEWEGVFRVMHGTDPECGCRSNVGISGISLCQGCRRGLIES